MMEMTRVASKAPKPMPAGGEAVAELLAVMSDLKDIIETENDFLRRGMPAALSDMTQRKTELADEYADLTQEVLADFSDEIVGNPILRQKLIESGEELRRLSQENMMRLESALDATRRRIEAVMSAIHAHDQEGRTYGTGKGMSIIGRYIDYAVNLEA
jgi:flagellar biosynthesis/type III secretory pathway chaperone